MKEKVTIPALQQMKRDGRKIVGVVVYDYQMAQIVDRAGVDIVSVGDSVGVNMWGHASERDVTLSALQDELAFQEALADWYALTGYSE